MNYPEKTAVTDGKVSYTYTEIFEICTAMGTALCKWVGIGEPVGIYLEKSADSVCAMLAAVFAGGFYSVLNTELPEGRLRDIAGVLSPSVIVTDENFKSQAEKTFCNSRIVTVNELRLCKPDFEKLHSIRERCIDTNLLYVNFTSGSTGIPKGIAVSHRSVIDFIDCFTETFNITDSDIIANQAPFDFDVSVKDIYSALKVGATLTVIPRALFSKPAVLADFLCEQRVTTMIWAVSALCLMTAFHTLDYKTPATVDKILFSGEVMPYKALTEFRKHLPDALYVNLYGPTEITCNCTYFILDNNTDYSSGIPIGKPFLNEDAFLLGDDNNLISECGRKGEICVRGTALAMGYYCSEKQTESCFVQNPLNSRYKELIYRTGDLGRYDENGNLVFCGRKDFQIKYMGHRIELEEVERSMSEVDGVEQCCCVFDERRGRLKGFYVGSIEKGELHSKMKKSVPAYMIPGILRKIDEMPLTKNGKTDRKRLAESDGK